MEIEACPTLRSHGRPLPPSVDSHAIDRTRWPSRQPPEAIARSASSTCLLAPLRIGADVMTAMEEVDNVALGLVADIRPSNVDKKSKEGEVDVRLCNYTDVYYGDRITAADGLTASRTSP